MRTIRSSNSTRLIWGGALLSVFATFTGLYGLVPLARGSLLAGLACLVLGGIVAVAGLAVIVIGARLCARVDPQAISWTDGLGRRRTVPWEQVARVLVPGRGDHGDAVALQLRDGRVLTVGPLRKMSGADASTRLSPLYLRAGATVQRAHQQWWARHGR